MKTQQIARAGLCVALLAVSAWVSVLIGLIVATTLVRLLSQTMPLFARVLAGDVALLVISYVCGTAQLMVVGSMGVAPAMAAAVLPFILPDAAKLAIGVGVGCAVDKALSSTLSRA